VPYCFVSVCRYCVKTAEEIHLVLGIYRLPTAYPTLYFREFKFGYLQVQNIWVLSCDIFRKLWTETNFVTAHRPPQALSTVD